VIDDLGSSGVLDLLGKVAPEAVDRLRVNCNINLPGSVPQHYHIDGFYEDEFYLCTIAVIDTDLDNGALDVVPGTNRKSYKYWQFVRERASRRATRMPMQQGDALLRKSTVWHRGMPNLSNEIRPQLTFTFGELIAPTSDPFLEYDGEITFWPNWYSTSRLARLREQAWAKAPAIASTQRFLASLVGREQQ
jgi:ectoine hydroxylase-related dioxygenase (phytanoyl-CoA dioxygenase family)